MLALVEFNLNEVLAGAVVGAPKLTWFVKLNASSTTCKRGLFVKLELLRHEYVDFLRRVAPKILKVHIHALGVRFADRILLDDNSASQAAAHRVLRERREQLL